MRGGKVKKGSGKTRGYIGYHTTWDGKIVFLRSKVEFIYARMLDIRKIPYKLECCTYEVRGVRYRPDFFIFDSNYNNIIKIVEIKGLDDKTTALHYLDTYRDFFTSLGIEYDAVWKFQALITKYDLKQDIQDWIQKSLTTYDFISDVSGENNPMFGKTHKESTVELIRQKALERQTEEYRLRNSKRQKEFYQSEAGLERRFEISKQRKAYAELNNPIVNKVCKECSTGFECKQKAKKEFCSGKCLRAWSYRNIPGYGSHKSKLNK